MKAITLFLFITLYTTATAQFTFRGLEWGASSAQILAKETDKLIKQDNFLISTSSSLSGYDCMLVFDLGANDALLSSGYILMEVASNNLFYYAFDKWRSALKEKYGAPNSDDEVWYDDLFRDDPNDIGTAIVRGDVAMKAQWTLEDGTLISLDLKGGNYEGKTSLMYLSPAAVEAIDKKSSNKDKF